ncbi:hypothetical protein U3516DRAFT_563513 [Neocallimastix sp. 'constans']|jgi:hypothetical protein
MLNKRASESDKQKTKKQRLNYDESDSQSVQSKEDNSEQENTPKRSTRLRSRTKSNDSKTKTNEISIKKITFVSSSVSEIKDDSKNKEENNDSNKITIPDLGRSLRKDKKQDKNDIDSDTSIASSVTSPRRGRKVSSKSDLSEAKSSKEKAKSKKSKSKMSSKSESTAVENTISEGNSEDVGEHIKLEEKIKPSRTIVVEIENKNNLVKQESITTISDVSDNSLQEIDATMNSVQTVSSVEKDDSIENIQKSDQSISNIKTKKLNIKIKNDNSNPKPNQFLTDKINNEIKDNNEDRNTTPTPHNNSSHRQNNKTPTPSSNHYNSRSHNKRKKKSLKKSEVSSSGRSVYIPAGLVNPFREKSHHQKVDERIKEDMNILRECIKSLSEINAKPLIENSETGTKKNENSQGTRRSLRRTSLANSHSTNRVSSPKTHHSPEQLTKLDSYNQGVLPFHALDDISKTEVNDDFCSICRQSTGCFLCCDSCPKSFHFDCINPPLDKSSIPEGIWECKECRAKKNVELLKDNPNDNIWTKLSKDLDRHNPKTFELPDWLVDEYENLTKNPVTGDYLDISQWKSIRISRNGTISQPSQSESYLKTIPICYKCGEGITKDHLVQCDYCDLSWHLDCLDPPLSSNPNINVILIGNANSNGIINKPNNNGNGHDNGNDHVYSKENIVIENHRIYGMKRKWMCPCHADWEMPKKRHKKSVIEVDIENLTEADFDSIEEFEAGRIDNDEDYNENSKNNIPSNQQQLSSDHTNTKDTNSKENNEVVKIKNENEINEVKRENSEEPYKPDKLHYSDNVKEIKKEINPLYVELDKNNINADAIQNEFINHVQNIKSTLRSYHSKVMNLPDQPIKYHSNIRSLYSNDDNKDLIPNIPEQDIEDWLSTVSSLQQDIARELSYRKSMKKFWENIRIEKLPDPPYDVYALRKKHLDKLEVLCKAALDPPYNQYVTSKNVTQLLDSKLLFNEDEKIKEKIMNESDELTLDQNNESSTTVGIISKDDPLFKQFLSWRKICKTILKPSSSII